MRVCRERVAFEPENGWGEIMVVGVDEGLSQGAEAWLHNADCRTPGTDHITHPANQSTTRATAAVILARGVESCASTEDRDQQAAERHLAGD